MRPQIIPFGSDRVPGIRHVFRFIRARPQAMKAG